MRSLSSLVRRRILIAILVPSGILSLGLASFLLVNILETAGRRVAGRCVDQAITIARFLDLYESVWETRMLELLAEKDRDARVSLWAKEYPEFCLLSVWDSTGSLGYSWPERDLLPPPSIPFGDWTGVETNPRCDGPVVRTSFDLEQGRVGVVAFRLAGFFEQLRPSDKPGTGFQSVVVDSAGYPVMDWNGAGTASDPMGRRAARGEASKGLYRDEDRLVAWSSYPVEDTPWTLIVRIQATDLLRQILPLVVLVLAWMILLLLLSRRMARSIASTVRGALQELSDRVRGVEEERWEKSGGASALVEIEGICREFDRMAERVAGREAARRQELEARTAQLERALREMETFSYSVSHDLRAPLRAIDGFSRVIEEDAEERLQPEEKDALRRIRRAAVRMGELIDDLLALSKATRAPLACREVDMDAMVREVVEQFTDLHPSRPVRWDIGELGSAFADPGLVRQIWTNLMSNAHKFTARKGDDAVVVVRAQAVEGGTRWTISDNGVGFDRAAATKLFQPFRRMHDDSEFHGTGIGLAIVQRIVERHGGTIEIDSEPDKGTVASFTLPRRPQE